MIQGGGFPGFKERCRGEQQNHDEAEKILFVMAISLFIFSNVYSQESILSDRELEMQTENTNGATVIFKTALISNACWDQEDTPA